MVRITKQREGACQVITVDGRLSADDVIELDKTVVSAPAAVRIDLQGLLSADSDGLDALRRLEARGIPLSRVPPYVRMLLEQPAEAAPTTGRAR